MSQVKVLTVRMEFGEGGFIEVSNFAHSPALFSYRVSIRTGMLTGKIVGGTIKEKDTPRFDWLDSKQNDSLAGLIDHARRMLMHSRKAGI